MKKIFKLFLVTLLLAAFLPTLGLAAKTNNYQQKIYKNILKDYLILTDLSKEQADQIYNQVQKQKLQYDTSADIEAIVYGEVLSNSYEDNVLYIQDNYDNLVKNISAEEKALIAQYFLARALQYYTDYGDPADFEDSKGPTPSNIAVPFGSTVAVATLTIFSDPTERSVGSSGHEIALARHSWVMIKNISTKNITVGKYSLAPNKSVCLGTFGNQKEHTGLWYNRECPIVRSGEYGGRVSISVNLMEMQLPYFNSKAVGYDRWSATNNCSAFASAVWNEVNSNQLSAGVIATPKTLASNIMKVSGYKLRAAVPFDGNVYYANGTGAIIRSIEHN